jgi:ribonuclease P protein component
MKERKRLKLPRTVRLTSGVQFAYVREHGRAYRGEFMTFAVADSASEEPARMGVITSKRVGAAVVRNRIRRRLRELFRTNQRQIRAGVWVVTIARATAARAPFAALQAEWLRLAERASILRA